MTRTFRRGGRTLSYPPISVQSGQFVAIVGPSGVGKTTWLALLGGLEQPSTGTIRVEPSSHTRPRALVSWVGQLNNSVGQRTIVENVAIGALASGASVSEALSSAERACQLVGISELLSVRASKVSGGELQRASVARTLLSCRPFIFADEPTGNLDSVATMDVVAAFKSAVEVGKGVVIVTHDLAVASNADLVVAL